MASLSKIVRCIQQELKVLDLSAEKIEIDNGKREKIHFSSHTHILDTLGSRKDAISRITALPNGQWAAGGETNYIDRIGHNYRDYWIAILNNEGESIKRWKSSDAIQGGIISDWIITPKGQLLVRGFTVHPTEFPPSMGSLGPREIRKDWLAILSSHGECLKVWEPSKSNEASIRSIKPLFDGRLVIGWHSGSQSAITILGSEGENIKTWQCPAPLKDVGEPIVALSNGMFVACGSNSSQYWIAIFDAKGECLRIWQPPSNVANSDIREMVSLSTGGLAIRGSYSISSGSNKDTNLQEWIVFLNAQGGLIKEWKVPLLNGATTAAIDKVQVLPEGGLAVLAHHKIPPNMHDSDSHHWIAVLNDLGECQRIIPINWSEGNFDITNIILLADQKCMFIGKYSDLSGYGYLGPLSLHAYDLYVESKEGFQKSINFSCRHLSNLDRPETGNFTVLPGEGIATPCAIFANSSSKSKPGINVFPLGYWLTFDGCNVKLYDQHTGSCTKTFSGHTDTITNLALLTDGFIATTATDQTTKIWDIYSGACVQTFNGITGNLLPTPDGKLAVYSTKDVITVCDLPKRRVVSSADFLPVWQALAVNRTVIECNFQGLALGNEGATGIAQMLRTNRTITQLNLDRTKITDEGAKALLASLKTNKKVIILSLSDNVINPLLIKCVHERLFQHQRQLKMSKIAPQISASVQNKAGFLDDVLLQEYLKVITTGDTEAVIRLIQREQRLLDLPIQLVKDQPPQTLVSIAFRQGSPKLLGAILQLLGHKGIRQLATQAEEGGEPLFRRAARILGKEGAQYIVQALEWNAADVEDRLFDAVAKKDLQVASVCIQLDIPLDITDDQGNTPLHAAVLSGSTAMIELLLRYGASTKATNSSGLKSEALAHSIGRPDLATLINTQKKALKLEPLVAKFQHQQEEMQKLMEANRQLKALLKEALSIQGESLSGDKNNPLYARIQTMIDKVEQ